MKHALILVDHGSRRPEAHAHLEGVAARVAARAPELAVYVAHMELAKPSLEQAVDQAVSEGAGEISVHPLFLAPGQHLLEDIPALLERARARHPEVRMRLTEPLGNMPELVEVILRAL